MATADRWQEIVVRELLYVSNTLPVPLDWPPFPEGDEKTQIAKDMLANPELWGVWEQVVWENPTWLEDNTAYRVAVLPEEESLRRQDEVKYLDDLSWIVSVEIIWYEVEGVRVMVWTVIVNQSIIVVLCPLSPIVGIIPFIPLVFPIDTGGFIRAFSCELQGVENNVRKKYIS